MRGARRASWPQIIAHSRRLDPLVGGYAKGESVNVIVA
jgi:hypothetical protein